MSYLGHPQVARKAGALGGLQHQAKQTSPTLACGLGQARTKLCARPDAAGVSRTSLPATSRAAAWLPAGVRPSADPIWPARGRRGLSSCSCLTVKRWRDNGYCGVSGSTFSAFGTGRCHQRRADLPKAAQAVVSVSVLQCSRHCAKDSDFILRRGSSLRCFVSESRVASCIDSALIGFSEPGRGLPRPPGGQTCRARSCHKERAGLWVSRLARQRRAFGSWSPGWNLACNDLAAAGG